MRKKNKIEYIETHNWQICEYCDLEFDFIKRLKRKHYFCCFKHYLFYIIRNVLFKIMDKDLV